MKITFIKSIGMIKTRLTSGLILIQPWATYIAKGKLNYLVRAFNTKKRGRVAIISSKNMDKTWLSTASDDELKEISNIGIGALGSVDIVEIIAISPEKVRGKLFELGGKNYLEFYPDYLIPYVTTGKKLYIWILKDAKLWDKTKNISKGGGIQWAIIDIEDE